MGKQKGKKQYSPSRKEVDKRTGEHTSRAAPDWWELEKLGLEKLRVCRRCHAIYFDKHWHTWARVRILAERLRKARVREDVCTECRWALDSGPEGKRNWEGEVVLTGLSDSAKKREVLALVRNVGKRATERDPEDQVIRIEDKGETVRILTTENQLAISIGKQIDRARKGGKLDIKFSHEDAPVRVTWQAPK